MDNGENNTEDVIIPTIGFEDVLENGGAKCSAVTWKASDGGNTLVTPFLKSNIKDMKFLSEFVQELVDYCLVDDGCMISK